MTQRPSVITDELRAKIGVEEPPAVYEVDKTGCRMFARAVGYTDPLFYDEGFAKSKGYRSIPVPPGFLGHRVYDPREAVTEGAEIRLMMPYQRVLNGGTDIEYLDTICAGDLLTVTGTALESLQEREGRQGPMLVATSRHTYRRGDKVVAIHRGTLIFY